MAFLADLASRARGSGARIVLVEGGDERVRGAATRLRDQDGLEPVLLVDAAGPGAWDGPVRRPSDDPELERYAELLVQVGATGGAGDAGGAGGPGGAGGAGGAAALDREAVVRRAQEPLVFAGLMVRAGDADGAVAGAAHTTADVVRAALRTVGSGPGVTTVSGAFYMVVPPFRGTGEPEVLTFVDAAVVPDPGVEQLVEIAGQAAIVRRRVVGDDPRVAFLSYATHGSAEGPSVEKVREAVDRFRRAFPDVAADGALQADAALIESVGRRKAPGSPVAGHANVLVFPDLAAANIAYKLVERIAGATAIGPILHGLARPFNDLSRGTTADVVRWVACVTALMAARS